MVLASNLTADVTSCEGESGGRQILVVVVEMVIIRNIDRECRIEERLCLLGSLYIGADSGVS